MEIIVIDLPPRDVPLSDRPYLPALPARYRWAKRQREHIIFGGWLLPITGKSSFSADAVVQQFNADAAD